MKINSVILKPVLTEKATDLVKTSVYSFEVNKKSNKNSIKDAVEKLYKVKVGCVRIMVKKGKIKRVGKKWKYKQLSDRKIAFVKLISGKIDVFPQA